MILDLGLPDMDGTEVIHGLRGWTRTPIIVLVGLGARSSQKVAALDAGADDYVTKPFGMDELLARLRAAVRRAAPPPDEPVVATADFTVDLAAKRVTRDGAEVRLTPTEWQLLEVLARNRGRLVTQKQLLRDVWGPAYGIGVPTTCASSRPAPAQAGARAVASSLLSPSPAWATASRLSAIPR